MHYPTLTLTYRRDEWAAGAPEGDVLASFDDDDSVSDTDGDGGLRWDGSGNVSIWESQHTLMTHSTKKTAFSSSLEITNSYTKIRL